MYVLLTYSVPYPIAMTKKPIAIKDSGQPIESTKYFDVIFRIYAIKSTPDKISVSLLFTKILK